MRFFSSQSKAKYKKSKIHSWREASRQKKKKKREGGGESVCGRETERGWGSGSVMFMIIRESTASGGGGAATMSGPQERTAKQVREWEWWTHSFFPLYLTSLRKLLQCLAWCSSTWMRLRSFAFAHSGFGKISENIWDRSGPAASSSPEEKKWMLHLKDNYLCLSFDVARVCLLLTKIAQKVKNSFDLHFQEMLRNGQAIDLMF